MKRLNSSDDFVSEAEEKSRNKTQIYSTEFQAMLDGLIQDECGGEAEELGDAVADKKRRLSSGQVKVLEKNFEVESKLEPERKSQLAEELGLQPRQVAIWFQNRRARFKTKQLERDYVILKENYNSLKLDFDNLEQENEALLAEVMKLKMKLNQENADSNAVLYAAAAKEEEESPASESMTNAITINGVDKEFDFLREDSKFLTFQQSSSPLLNWIQFSNSRSSAAADEHRSLVNTEESCSFFSVDHAPTMHW